MFHDVSLICRRRKFWRYRCLGIEHRTKQFFNHFEIVNISKTYLSWDLRYFVFCLNRFWILISEFIRHSNITDKSQLSNLGQCNKATVRSHSPQFRNICHSLVRLDTAYQRWVCYCNTPLLPLRRLQAIQLHLATSRDDDVIHMYFWTHGWEICTSKEIRTIASF